MSELAVSRRAGLRRAWDRARLVGRALGMLALGIGFAWGGIALTGYAGGILTSDDAALSRNIAARSVSSETDPFAPRRASSSPAITRPVSLEDERYDALFEFGFGLLIAYVSLFGFAGTYFAVAEALGFYRDRDQAQ